MLKLLTADIWLSLLTAFLAVVLLIYASITLTILFWAVRWPFGRRKL